MLEDTLVLYRSEEDGCWIAHSLRTDQIGTGATVMEAMADGIKAVRQVAELAASDATIALLREAPQEVQELARRARRIPREVYEIAFKMAHGQWPDYLEPGITPRDVDEPLAFTEELPALAK